VRTGKVVKYYIYGHQLAAGIMRGDAVFNHKVFFPVRG